MSDKDANKGDEDSLTSQVGSGHHISNNGNNQLTDCHAESSVKQKESSTQSIDLCPVEPEHKIYEHVASGIPERRRILDHRPLTI